MIRLNCVVNLNLHAVIEHMGRDVWRSGEAWRIGCDSMRFLMFWLIKRCLWEIVVVVFFLNFLKN